MQNNQNLTVITTHINSDFDAVASMLAAQKLYPDALLVFPGSQEKTLRNFFIKSIFYLFNMADIKDIDLSSVKRLVLVDTRQANRIGKLSSLLQQSNIEIHIYDHHPPAINDIKSNFEVNELTGATITILTEIIKNKGIPISPDEATIMCLGIYEDTGSFTYSSTTEKDFSAAAFLLSKGANLNIIANLISREITPEQIGLLSDMIQSLTHYSIHGVDIVITIFSRDNYVADIALLVQKIIKMENLNAIFVIARMADNIYIVARSRISEVDVADILLTFGGGGHSFAASATVKGETLTQVEQKLISTLYQKIKARRYAKELMSFPVITISPNVTCREASTILTRYNINTLIVTDNDSILGFISRQIIEKALFHKLDIVPVCEYMNTEIVTVNPDAHLSEIQTKIIDNKQRILPVVDNNKLIGVITRTDLLNVLVYQTHIKSDKGNIYLNESVGPRTRNIIKFMNERLSDRLIKKLKDIGKIADELNLNAYIVGGFVRDLFLYKTNEDIDIVIEGDGIAFAKKFASIFKAKIYSHETFGTAIIKFSDGSKIDVASARIEYYKFPAALPVVEMSSIKLDLFRRDFTINALAIQLNHDKFGTLIDFFGSQKDLKEKIIRVLHNLSFVEDPTRIFRAIRFEQRFGFTIGKLTSSLIENAVKMDFFKRLSGRRVFAEVKQILEEENPTNAIIRLNDYNLLSAIHPLIKLNKEIISQLDSVKKTLAWHDLLFLEERLMKWAIYFLALLKNLDQKISEEICNNFELPVRQRDIFSKERIIANQILFWLEQNLPTQNSLLYSKLSIFKTELILYMMAQTKYEKVKKAISFYLTQLKNEKISITGKDLRAINIKEGPIYGKILNAVLDAKLNGLLSNREDELSFVKNYVS
ncbi:MAG: CBS domain-containing protein [Desulfobacterales bacterium]|nr:CBS domain-containing protein [Desulfobacterales bacterium]